MRVCRAKGAAAKGPQPRQPQGRAKASEVRASRRQRHGRGGGKPETEAWERRREHPVGGGAGVRASGHQRNGTHEGESPFHREQVLASVTVAAGQRARCCCALRALSQMPPSGGLRRACLTVVNRCLTQRRCRQMPPSGALWLPTRCANGRAAARSAASPGRPCR
jgi:hypothetical protein